MSWRSGEGAGRDLHMTQVSIPRATARSRSGFPLTLLFDSNSKLPSVKPALSVCHREEKVGGINELRSGTPLDVPPQNRNGRVLIPGVFILFFFLPSRGKKSA